MRDDLPTWLIALCTMGAVLMCLLAFYAYVPDWVTGKDSLRDIASDTIGFAFFGLLSVIGFQDLWRRWKGQIGKKITFLLFLILLSLPIFAFIGMEFVIMDSLDYDPNYSEIDRCLDHGGRWNYESILCEYNEY